MRIPHASLRGSMIALLIAAGTLTMSGCGSTVSGQVYFDTNQNTRQDSGEIGVPFAKMLVTLDGNTVAERYADGSGTFRVKLKAFKSGTVCISTDLAYAQANISDIQASINAPAATTPPAAAAQAKSQSTGDAGDTGSGSGDDADDDTDEETQQPAATPAPEVAPSWSGGQYCQAFKGKGFNVTIPVAFDFAASLEEMPKRLSVQCYSGLECNVSILYPDGCKLRPLALPVGLSAANDSEKGISFNASSNSVSFGDAAYTQDSAAKAQSTSTPTSTSQTPSLAVSSYHVINVALKADADIASGTTKVSIEPEARCMEQELTLPEIPIELIKDLKVAIRLNMVTEVADLASGKEAEVEITVENQGKGVIAKGDLTITPPEGSTLEEMEGCSNLVTKFICPIEKITSTEPYELTVNFTLPTVTADTDATFNAIIMTPDMGAPLEAEPIEFKIKKAGSGGNTIIPILNKTFP